MVYRNVVIIPHFNCEIIRGAVFERASTYIIMIFNTNKPENDSDTLNEWRVCVRDLLAEKKGNRFRLQT